MTMLHDPGNAGPIDTVYVFLSVDAEGRHGIIAGMVPGIGATPLITGSRKAAEAMKPLAEDVARMSGKKAALFAFSRAGKLWEFDPRF